VPCAPTKNGGVSNTRGPEGYSHAFGAVHFLVYTKFVRRRDLEKELRSLGWRSLRHGGRHDVWTDGEQQEAIPRHSEINEKLARAILRRAQKRK